MEPFLILGLPRCRTAWLAEFLSQPGRPCVHEPSKLYQGPEDLEAALADDRAAISDSMLTLRWRDILRQRPRARIATVYRPIPQIMASFARLGFGSARLEKLLRMIERERRLLHLETPVLSVPFEAMEREDACADIFRWCLHAEMPRGHWQRWAPIKIQANVSETMRAADANQDGIRRTYPELWAA